METITGEEILKRGFKPTPRFDSFIYNYPNNIGFYDSISIDKFEWRGDFGVNVMMICLGRHKFLCAIQDLEKSVEKTIESVKEFRKFLSDNDLNIFE